ncbi:MAG TPA: ATP-dependent Clp protease adaptor ClpS [Candidatus Hydrogenedentes bacterium]|nr:ATP-dependent Clp protease adaptor ClpS [Candidatus Hydrogenedentota bacterium]
MPDYVSNPTDGATKTRRGVATRPREDLEPPPLYKVLLHNDHYTTMQFVVDVLEGVFSKPHDAAVRIMLEVHHGGIGVAGVYPAEVAETKILTVHAMAQEHGYPLKCSMEPE